MPRTSKKLDNKSKKAKNAKINVTYCFHLWLDNIRKVTEIVSTSHYKKPILDANEIHLDGPFEDIQLSKYFVSMFGIGVVDIYSEHPSIQDYVQIACYNNKRRSLTWKPAKVIFEPSKKSKKKPNQSLLYQIVLRPKQSGGSDYYCDVKLRLLSLKTFIDLKLRFIPCSSQTQTKDFNYNDVNKNEFDVTAIKSSGWTCHVCTFMNYDNELKGCSMCRAPRAKPVEFITEDAEEKKPHKETMIDDECVANIDDLMSDEDDIDIKIVEHQQPKKKRKLDTFGASQITYSPPSNAKTNFKFGNDDNTNNDSPKDVKTLIINIEANNKWLVGQTFKIVTVENVRIAGNRFAALRNVDDRLGCGPIGVISGCGSRTRVKNLQKLLIAFGLSNENRRRLGLDMFKLPVGSTMHLDQYCKDRFNKTRKQLEQSIKQPGDDWPEVGDDGITEEEVKRQQVVMQKRYDTYKAYKNLKKQIK